MEPKPPPDIAYAKPRNSLSNEDELAVGVGILFSKGSQCDLRGELNGLERNVSHVRRDW